MASPVSLGQFEQIVLTAVLALQEDAYGIAVHSKVEQLSRPKKVSLGAVYATLDRLEDKGLLISQTSDPVPERGGRARRYYRLEKFGEKALRESADTARRICDTIEEITKGFAWKPPRR